MAMNWDDLKVILAICREGSLSGAAKVLGTSHSTVFRQINAIEKKLATRFFNRLSHGYEMTEAGETVLARAPGIEDNILDLEMELKNKDLRLKGTIRLTAPEGITNYLLLPHLARFYQQHPEIQIDLIVSSDDLKLTQHQADIAIRTTTKPPATSIGKKVCDFNLGIYATEAYLQKGVTETKKKTNSPINGIQMNRDFRHLLNLIIPYSRNGKDTADLNIILARMYMHNDNYGMAEVCLEKALTQERFNPRIYYYMSFLHESR